MCVMWIIIAAVAGLLVGKLATHPMRPENHLFGRERFFETQKRVVLAARRVLVEDIVYESGLVPEIGRGIFIVDASDKHEKDARPEFLSAIYDRGFNIFFPSVYPEGQIGVVSGEDRHAPIFSAPNFGFCKAITVFLQLRAWAIHIVGSPHGYQFPLHEHSSCNRMPDVDALNINCLRDVSVLVGLKLGSGFNTLLDPRSVRHFQLARCCYGGIVGSVGSFFVSTPLKASKNRVPQPAQEYGNRRDGHDSIGMLGYKTPPSHYDFRWRWLLIGCFGTAVGIYGIMLSHVGLSIYYSPRVFAKRIAYLIGGWFAGGPHLPQLANVGPCQGRARPDSIDLYRPLLACVD